MIDDEHGVETASKPRWASCDHVRGVSGVHEEADDASHLGVLVWRQPITSVALLGLDFVSLPWLVNFLLWMS